MDIARKLKSNTAFADMNFGLIFLVRLIQDQISANLWIFRKIRKPIGDTLDGLGQDWTLRRYILHLNDI